MKFSKEEAENIILSLQIRIGIIETGEPLLRAMDAEKMGKHEMIKVLKEEQVELILATEYLIEKIREEIK